MFKDIIKNCKILGTILLFIIAIIFIFIILKWSKLNEGFNGSLTHIDNIRHLGIKPRSSRGTNVDVSNVPSHISEGFSKFFDTPYMINNNNEQVLTLKYKLGSSSNGISGSHSKTSNGNITASDNTDTGNDGGNGGDSGGNGGDSGGNGGDSGGGGEGFNIIDMDNTIKRGKQEKELIHISEQFKNIDNILPSENNYLNEHWYSIFE